MSRALHRPQAEAAFILACVREPAAGPPGEVSKSALLVEDWSAVLELADANRVTSRILRAVRSEAVPLPDKVERELTRRAARSIAQTMVVDIDLGQALRALAEESIRVVTLKGPGLARTVYEEPALRPYDDIDLGADAAAVDGVAATLVRAGFSEITQRGESSITSRDFVAPTTQTLIELHSDLLQLGLRPKGDAGRWARTRQIPGLPGALMLGLEDQLVSLSIHAHKHGFGRLAWLKDVDRLVRAADLDWDLVESLCREEAVGPSVWLTLDVARELLGTPAPPALMRSLRPWPTTRLMYRAVWPRGAVRSLRGRMRRRAVQLNESESWRGIVPSAIFMGRRMERIRVLAGQLAGTPSTRR